MKAYTREELFWKAIAEGRVEELPTPMNAREHYMRLLVLREMGGVQDENALSVQIPEKETDFLGKKTGDLVSAVEIVMDGTIARVIGTAHHITGYTEFNPAAPEEQEGYYFPVEFKESGASKMSLYKNGVISKKDIVYDPQVVFRISDTETEFAIETDTGKRISFDFSGLVLESE